VTDLLNPPTADLRATTKKLITVIGDALDSVSDNDRAATAMLDILNDVKALPLSNRETAAKLVERVYREVGYDGTRDAALTLAVSHHRKMQKL
jgi:uncharacterized protein YpuA (DUF1002 family)